MSWTYHCPVLKSGACPEITGTESTGWPYFVHFFIQVSTVCPCSQLGVLMSIDIRRSNDAIADFFHCENIADQLVENTRFKCMLKQAWLVGGEFGPQMRKNWR